MAKKSVKWTLVEMRNGPNSFLALLIERVAELSCSKPWCHIREALDRLQVTKFENSSHRFSP